MGEIPFFWSQPAAVIRVTGEDAATFLQSQCSQDLRGEPGTVRYGLWLDHRGRIQADSFVLRLPAGDEYLLVSYFSAGDALCRKLQNHIVADDVDLRDETDRWRLLSLVPTAEGAILPDCVIRCPERESLHAQSGFLVFQGRRARTPWLEVLCPQEQAEALTRAMGEMPEYEALSLEEVETLRLEACLPKVPQEAGPGDLPPEAGLMEAVSLEKGCYLGQEVLNRIARLERTVRRLVVVDLTGPTATGASVTQAGEPVGELRSCVETLDGYQGFAMVRAKALENTPVTFEIGAQPIFLHGPQS